MSTTETHVGRFKILAEGKENVLKYLKEHPEINVKFSTWNGEIDDIYSDDPKYEIIYYPKKDLSLIEYIHHQEFDDSADIYHFQKEEDGTISFICQFYNGGTFIGEVLGEFNNPDYQNYVTG